MFCTCLNIISTFVHIEYRCISVLVYNYTCVYLVYGSVYTGAYPYLLVYLPVRCRSVLGSIVIANYITVTTDSKTSIHKDKDHNMLFVKLSQEV